MPRYGPWTPRDPEVLPVRLRAATWLKDTTGAAWPFNLPATDSSPPNLQLRDTLTLNPSQIIRDWSSTSD